MGIKSTVFLTREEAERRYIDYVNKLNEADLRTFVSGLHSTRLENLLEQINDMNSDGGEGFENYLIEEN